VPGDDLDQQVQSLARLRIWKIWKIV